MASNLECQFNKNSLFHCYFLAILPAGKILFMRIPKTVSVEFALLTEQHVTHMEISPLDLFYYKTTLN